MIPSSAKQKGRSFQQHVRDELLKMTEKYGLEADDCRSTGMGQGGVDLQLSPAAKKLIPFHIECKNVEKLNVVGVFIEHYKKYGKLPGLTFLAHRRNRTEPMVTLRLADFLALYSEYLSLKHPTTLDN
jgi:hypothetical protein